MSFFIRLMTRFAPVHTDSSIAEQESPSIRWGWFCVGCVCLAAGSVYLRSVELRSSELDVAGAIATEQAVVGVNDR